MPGLRKRTVVLAGLLIISCGCSGVGPRSIGNDRFNYTWAISESWKDQMLLNLVKLRYGDTPTFLEVASVINQYTVEGEVSGNLGWNQLRPGDSQLVGGAGRFSDRPTITYVPLQGEKFTRSLMTPIPPTALMSLVVAGYPVDAVFRICVQSLNGLNNRFGGQMTAQPGDERFYQVLKLLREVQISQAVGIRVSKSEGSRPSTVLFFRREVPEDIHQKALEARKLLGLDPNISEVDLAYGSIPKNRKEIAVLSRSMISILTELASNIDVPAEHIEQHRTYQVDFTDTLNGEPLHPLLKIYSSKTLPDYAFTGIKYRDYWFWIDDRDGVSKRVFTFLMFLFSLAETGSPQGLPVITVGAG